MDVRRSGVPESTVGRNASSSRSTCGRSEGSASGVGIPDDGLPDGVGVGVGLGVGVGRGVGRGVGLAVGLGERLATATWFGFGVGDGDGEAAGATVHPATTTTMATPIHAADLTFMDPP